MLLTWIIVGLIAGFLANLFTGAVQNLGCAARIVAGMIGSIVGGAVLTLLTNGQVNLTFSYVDFSITSILVSTLGAVIFLGIVELLKK